MSIRAVSWALQQKIASRALRAALTTLAGLADKHGVVVASQAVIAADLGVLDRQVRVHLCALEALGVIRRDHRNRRNRGRTTDRITLALDQMFDLSKADISAAGYDVRKGKFVRCKAVAEDVSLPVGKHRLEKVSLPEGLQPLALPVGKHRAIRDSSIGGSAEPKRGLSDQGGEATRRRAKQAKLGTPVEGPAPTPETPSPGKDPTRRLKARIYARHRTALHRLNRGTVH